MKRALLGLLLVASSYPASALTIVLDYTYDTGNFFGGNATANAALQRAALDVGNAITSSLGALTPSTLTFTGTNGSTTATVDWALDFTNPTTNTAVSLANFTSSANEYRIFVGARSIGGGTLGLGGSSSASLGLSGNGAEGQWSGAVSQMVSASNAVMSRGDGPLIGVINGNVSLGASNPAYSLQFGLLAGSLSFDTGAAWHFDHTTAVAGGKYDFYSVAMHEIIHSLGFGGGFSWGQNHSGTTWLGANGIAANGGSGAGLLSSGEDHVSISSSIMNPNLPAGVRRTLGALELAMLDDIGFSVAAIPEASTLSFCVMLGGLGVVIHTRRRRVSVK